MGFFYKTDHFTQLRLLFGLNPVPQAINSLTKLSNSLVVANLQMTYQNHLY
jgi:hypothetical protein